MSVNYQVDVIKRKITSGTGPDGFDVTGQLASFESINFFARDFVPDPANQESAALFDDRNFDTALATSGSATTEQVFVDVRSIEVPEFLAFDDKINFEDFFTVVGTTDARFNVLRRYNKNGKIVYDLFYSTTTSPGSTDYRLTVVTVRKPPGNLPTPVTTPTAPSFSKAIQRKVGNDFYYDLFLLSIDT